MVELLNQTNRCIEGYAGPVCAVCAVGWAKSREGCSKCENVSQTIGMILTLTLIVMSVALVQRLRRMQKQKKIDSLHHTHASTRWPCPGSFAHAVVTGRSWSSWVRLANRFHRRAGSHAGGCHALHWFVLKEHRNAASQNCQVQVAAGWCVSAGFKTKVAACRVL